MRIAIIQFPGSNCERETILAVERAGMTPVECLWNHSPDALEKMQGYIIVGGFSYEDRSRAGIIAALDPVMTLIAEQAALGKPVLGICNGAQILVETGLVPGLENNKVGLALTDNKRVQGGKVLGTGFYNAWVNMRVSDDYQRNAFTRYLSPKDILNIPVANAEGRFVISPALLAEIKMQGLNVFQYCNEAGEIIDDFPVNPNGSVDNIAAISNKAGNVLAMMPHPERTPAGDPIFASMRQYIEKGKFVEVTPLHYYPRRKTLTAYQAPASSQTCLVESLITDNQAITVEKTLRSLGYPVRIKRYIHWEITGADAALMDVIKKTGVLFNPRKEQEVSESALKENAFLVQAKEDWQGLLCLQTLKDHFAVNGVDAIKQGIVWEVVCETNDSEACINELLNTQVFYNPYAHECYRYKSK